MCGILLAAGQSAATTSSPASWSSLATACTRRGPHAHATINKYLGGGSELRLLTSVLSLRGTNLTAQPFASTDGRYLFAWNGQVYSIERDGQDSSSSSRAAAAQRLARGDNDGRILFEWLCEELHTSGDVETALDTVFSSAALRDAEWAMTFVEVESGSVYFGRDALGRRSLLVSQTSDKFVLSSVASREAIDAGLTFKEVECSSLWKWQASSVILTSIQPRAAAVATLCPSDTFGEPSTAEREAALDALHATLLESVKYRVCSVRGLTAQETTSPIAILFSGGLDCTLLAHLANVALPKDQTIDLINVAFENPRVLAATDRPPYDTPDRLLSRRSFAHLQSLSTTQRFNLIEVNVSYSDYLAHKPHILATMHPCDSVMDLSLAAVLFFASRCATSVDDDSTTATSARVYLSGLGADELFGGYSRHRGAFATGGYPRAVEELQLDLDRLPTRNLGRDDRVLSSHGREARYPFLALPVVKLAASLPVRIKAEWGRGEGEGDKLLLRQLARRIGLGEVVNEKKRAMQFGARSAKMEVGATKAKGHHSVRGDEAAVPAPREVFTTLCYDASGGLSVDDLLQPLMTASRHAATLGEAQGHVFAAVAEHHALSAHIPLLATHIARLYDSMQALAQVWPAEWRDAAGRAAQEVDHWAGTALDHLAAELGKVDINAVRRRVRWAIGRGGEATVTQAVMAPAPSSLPLVRLDSCTTQQPPHEAILLNKTDARDLYDEARRRVNATLGAAGGGPNAVFDVLLWTQRTPRSRRLLTESSIANIIVELDDGRLVTPKLRPRRPRGKDDPVLFLPGLMRQEALRRGLVVEEDINVDVIRQAGRRVWLCNALRGVFEARLVG